VTPSPIWNGTACSNTYCHGAFKNGATAAMTWATDVALTCASCHGSPPGGTHPANSNCGGCHAGYTSTSVNKVTHLNGALEVNAMTCTSCHGKAGTTATATSPLNAAPPVDVAGASTGIRVGAHQKHLLGGSYSNAFSCQTCHASVGTYTTAHTDGVRQVGFTGAANANLRMGTWQAGTGTAAGTCASTWCHGAVIGRSGGNAGGTMLTPAWNGTITACTPCHANPPSTGRHTSVSSHRSQSCGACHASYSSTTVNKAQHVNGTRDVGGSGTRITSWNASTRTCSSSCHGSQTW
jgi:predicted CxxxxCH...CXXCH cytochrome family protein